MVTCYGYRCPLRSQCKKGGKCTKTCKTPDDAHWNILQHLQKSPYHGLEEEEAKELIATVVLEVWEEEEKEHEKKMAQESKWEPQWQQQVPAPPEPDRGRKNNRAHRRDRSRSRRGQTPARATRERVTGRSKQRSSSEARTTLVPRTPTEAPLGASHVPTLRATQR